jgi:hypothetical protein
MKKQSEVLVRPKVIYGGFITEEELKYLEELSKEELFKHLRYYHMENHMYDKIQKANRGGEREGKRISNKSLPAYPTVRDNVRGGESSFYAQYYDYEQRKNVLKSLKISVDGFSGKPKSGDKFWWISHHKSLKICEETLEVFEQVIEQRVTQRCIQEFQDGKREIWRKDYPLLLSLTDDPIHTTLELRAIEVINELRESQFKDLPSRIENLIKEERKL